MPPKMERREKERPGDLADEPRESKRGNLHRDRAKAREDFVRSGAKGFPAGIGLPPGGNREKRDRDGDGNEPASKKSKDGGPLRLGSQLKPFEAAEETVAEVPWVSTGLKVRIVDEDGPFSKANLKKGYIKAVNVDKLCADVEIDGETFKQVPQKKLETVVSKGATRVEVCVGQHRGKVVELIERDARENKAVVKLQDLELEFLLDQVCEFKQ
eukprot:TRINITY_DN51628_c0_g1_i1.p1 TRINITY_DN51628_c0_g1~~TRINITY_DN51628_c0_g1_i1.p1  ORF type:complete len:213 (+),score=59.32 TRINITY_DN51628_c0_g1_i1:150-788(+)